MKDTQMTPYVKQNKFGSATSCKRSVQFTILGEGTGSKKSGAALLFAVRKAWLKVFWLKLCKLSVG